MIYKKFQKETTRTCFTESQQETEGNFTVFLLHIVDVRVLCMQKAEDDLSLRDIGWLISQHNFQGVLCIDRQITVFRVLISSLNTIRITSSNLMKFKSGVD